MFTTIAECQKGLKTRERKQNWWGSVNMAKKHKNVIFSLGSQRNILNFTYSEPARRDDFGKIVLNGMFFVLGPLQAPCGCQHVQLSATESLFTKKHIFNPKN